MRVFGQQSLVGIVPAVEGGSSSDIVGEVGGERSAVGGGGYRRGGGYGILGGHDRDAATETAGGLVVTLHITGAGGVLVAAEGDGVGIARRRDVGGGGVVIPAALRGVIPVGGGKDHVTCAAAAGSLGGDRRGAGHGVHRDAHGHAAAFATCRAVEARYVVGRVFREVLRTAVARVERRSAFHVGVPAAAGAVGAGRDVQSLAARAAKALVGNVGGARCRVHRYRQRDGAVTSGGVRGVDGVSAACAEGCVEEDVGGLAAAKVQRQGGGTGRIHRQCHRHGAVATVGGREPGTFRTRFGEGHAIPRVGQLVAADGL